MKYFKEARENFLYIDNVLSNFNEILLNKYIEHDKSINGKGIVN